MKKGTECKKSRDGYHYPQDSSKNTIVACVFCGKILPTE